MCADPRSRARRLRDTVRGSPANVDAGLSALANGATTDMPTSRSLAATPVVIRADQRLPTVADGDCEGPP